ncbi:uncharacterized protein LOC119687739 [Teleopsis dalmanni]|uniref:uncharacterized protein LOC119687739 n=1 Tax=Teleopsis dalmanni TaxID=139649 RepID=UPI0018CDE924|nr:uncharacterized protein LOC119687739 [Teleopsis dalmanni]
MDANINICDVKSKLNLREKANKIHNELKEMKKDFKEAIESLLDLNNIKYNSINNTNNNESQDHEVGMSKSDISFEQKYELYIAARRKGLSKRIKSVQKLKDQIETTLDEKKSKITMELNIDTENKNKSHNAVKPDLRKKYSELWSDLKEMKRNFKHAIEDYLELDNIPYKKRNRPHKKIKNPFNNALDMSETDVSLEEIYELFCATRCKRFTKRVRFKQESKNQMEIVSGPIICRKGFENQTSSGINANMPMITDEACSLSVIKERENMNNIPSSAISNLISYKNTEKLAHSRNTGGAPVVSFKITALKSKNLGQYQRIRSEQVSRDQIETIGGLKTCQKRLGYQSSSGINTTMPIMTDEACSLSVIKEREKMNNIPSSAISNLVTDYQISKMLPKAMKGGNAPEVSLNITAMKSKNLGQHQYKIMKNHNIGCFLYQKPVTRNNESKSEMNGEIIVNIPEALKRNAIRKNSKPKPGHSMKSCYNNYKYIIDAYKNNNTSSASHQKESIYAMINNTSPGPHHKRYPNRNDEIPQIIDISKLEMESERILNSPLASVTNANGCNKNDNILKHISREDCGNHQSNHVTPQKNDKSSAKSGRDRNHTQTLPTNSELHSSHRSSEKKIPFPTETQTEMMLKIPCSSRSEAINNNECSNTYMRLISGGYNNHQSDTSASKGTCISPTITRKDCDYAVDRHTNTCHQQHGAYNNPQADRSASKGTCISATTSRKDYDYTVDRHTNTCHQQHGAYNNPQADRSASKGTCISPTITRKDCDYAVDRHTNTCHQQRGAYNNHQSDRSASKEPCISPIITRKDCDYAVDRRTNACHQQRGAYNNHQSDRSASKEPCISPTITKKDCDYAVVRHTNTCHQQRGAYNNHQSDRSASKEPCISPTTSRKDYDYAVVRHTNTCHHQRGAYNNHQSDRSASKGTCISPTITRKDCDYAVDRRTNACHQQRGAYNNHQSDRSASKEPCISPTISRKDCDNAVVRHTNTCHQQHGAYNNHQSDRSASKEPCISPTTSRKDYDYAVVRHTNTCHHQRGAYNNPQSDRSTSKGTCISPTITRKDCDYAVDRRINACHKQRGAYNNHQSDRSASKEPCISPTITRKDCDYAVVRHTNTCHQQHGAYNNHQSDRSASKGTCISPTINRKDCDNAVVRHTNMCHQQRGGYNNPQSDRSASKDTCISPTTSRKDYDYAVERHTSRFYHQHNSMNTRSEDSRVPKLEMKSERILNAPLMLVNNKNAGNENTEVTAKFLKDGSCVYQYYGGAIPKTNVSSRIGNRNQINSGHHQIHSTGNKEIVAFNSRQTSEKQIISKPDIKTDEMRHIPSLSMNKEIGTNEIPAHLIRTGCNNNQYIDGMSKQTCMSPRVNSKNCDHAEHHNTSGQRRLYSKRHDEIGCFYNS